ncbi:MAG: cysteine synthase B [Betaproteobacteria bacterium TMED82]|mgnify:CR=1 FL=1|nr:MAG: cysteine synthase B [Betaproteobacteria bacterium TMED82]
MFQGLIDAVGNTPLVRLNVIPGKDNHEKNNIILGKLEGNNPAGSVKDRAAVSMISGAKEKGYIQQGDLLIEATSGNTGIALAMAAKIMGFKMRLIMPENLSIERRQVMKAFGADLVLVSKSEGMEGARDLARSMESEGHGYVLDQFSNNDNWLAHYRNTGKEILSATGNKVSHFVSAMGTTGTITGVSRCLKEYNSDIQIIGVQPEDGSQIAGIRKWPEAYIPPIRSLALIDKIEEVSQEEAEEMCRRLAVEEGIFCGPSGAGSLCVALRIAKLVSGSRIVFIVCDRGDRYLSAGIFPS